MNPYLNWIDFYANTYGVDPELARRIALRESKFDPNAKSPAGAIGIMQLMPGTAKGLGVDPWNPEQNIKGGIKYYSQMRDKFGPVMGLAAYNWGEGNVGKYLKGDIKDMPGETQRYLAELGPYADKNQYHAPMSPTGQSGVPPEVMPVAAPETPTTIPPAPTGERKMDDYEQMKIFNPYVQMALGILSGNSGMSKGEAFANAMQGGLRANLTGQEAQRRAKEDKIQSQLMKQKMSEYERLRAAAENFKVYAAERLKQGGPMAPMWELASKMEPEQAAPFMKMYGDQQELEAKRGLWDAQAKYYLGEGRQNSQSALLQAYEMARQQGFQGTLEEFAPQFLSYGKSKTTPKEQITLTEIKDNLKGAVEEAFGDTGAIHNITLAEKQAISAAGRAAQKNGESVYEAMLSKAQEIRQSYSKERGWWGLGSYSKEKNPSTIKTPTGTAPQAAIDMLKSDPEKYKDAFQKKYGYLPEGF